MFAPAPFPPREAISGSPQTRPASQKSRSNDKRPNSRKSAWIPRESATTTKGRGNFTQEPELRLRSDTMNPWVSCLLLSDLLLGTGEGHARDRLGTCEGHARVRLGTCEGHVRICSGFA